MIYAETIGGWERLTIPQAENALVLEIIDKSGI